MKMLKPHALLLAILVLKTSLPVAGNASLKRATINPEDAITQALNHIVTTDSGLRLLNRQHQVEYTATGVSFLPTSSAPDWHWQLQSISSQNIKATRPEIKKGDDVHYRRGTIVEQYLARAESIEQRFVLTEPLVLKGQDLVIRGTVRSDGQFVALDNGWRWRNAQGEVKLGHVTVFDAAGQILPANMTVSADRTEIRVTANVLASAEYPVTIDPEIGTNDFRISDTGGIGNTTAQPEEPAVAYNSTDNEYLVVWAADDTDDAATVDEELEIYAQRIDAETGAEVGTNDFRVSDANGLGTGGGVVSTFQPAVAYNSVNNEYLIVWAAADTDTMGISTGETEIFGQRLNAATGAEVGTNDFRISDTGDNGVANADARFPRVAYNPDENEYLVVWVADGEMGLANDETEIYGQRLDASDGSELGDNDFRISDAGPDNDAGFVATAAAVAYNSTESEYLVVWQANIGLSGVFDDREIFGQRLNAVTGAEVGDNDFRISDAGAEGLAGALAITPEVAHNSVDNEYLVVWETNDPDVLASGGGETEIFGQRLDNIGQEIGDNDFVISDAAGLGGQSFDATRPAVAYNSVENEYLVTWQADDIDSPGVANNEFEIFGQRIEGGTGNSVGDNDFRISDAGGDGLNGADTRNSMVAFNTTDNEFLVVWESDDTDVVGLVDDEFEIFGQRLSFAADLTVNKTDNADTISGDDPLVYTITVSNIGGRSVFGATVMDILPANLDNGVWTCIADPNASCTAAGTGDIMDSQVDLDPGTSVVYTLTADPLVDEGDIITNTAEVSAPAATPDRDLSNNRSTDISRVEGIFSDGFEAVVR